MKPGPLMIVRGGKLVLTTFRSRSMFGMSYTCSTFYPEKLPMPVYQAQRLIWSLWQSSKTKPVSSMLQAGHDLCTNLVCPCLYNHHVIPSQVQVGSSQPPASDWESRNPALIVKANNILHFSLTSSCKKYPSFLWAILGNRVCHPHCSTYWFAVGYSLAQETS